METDSQLNIVNDQIGSPTFAADLAETILHIIKNNNWNPGIYHYSNLVKSHGLISLMILNLYVAIRQ